MLVTFDVDFEEILFQSPKASILRRKPANFRVLVGALNSVFAVPREFISFSFNLHSSSNQLNSDSLCYTWANWSCEELSPPQCLRRLRWLGAIKPVLIAPCLIWAVWEGGSCAASSLNLLERIEIFNVFYTELGPGSLSRPSICRPMQWLIHLAVLQRIAANALLVAWICYAFLRWWRTAQALPPDRWLPHATTDPSVTIAANALLVAWIFCTLLSWVWTFELSPPEAWEPQARTDPSARIAAKAHFVAWSCCTFLSKPWTFEIFWAVTTSIWITPGYNPVSTTAPLTSLKNPCPNDRCAGQGHRCSIFGKRKPMENELLSQTAREAKAIHDGDWFIYKNNSTNGHVSIYIYTYV